MNKAKKPAFIKLGVYYLYVRCNEHPNMDAHFQPFLDPMLLGDTVGLSISRSSSSSVVDHDNDAEEDGLVVSTLLRYLLLVVVAVVMMGIALLVRGWLVLSQLLV